MWGGAAKRRGGTVEGRRKHYCMFTADRWDQKLYLRGEQRKRVAGRTSEKYGENAGKPMLVK